MKRLTPAEALARAVGALVAQGFAVSARNTRGDSVYLKPGACAFALRVSNHARTPKQRKNHPDAITSLVLRDPTSEAALAEAVAVAVRNFAGERAKRERGPAGNAMTDQGSRPCDQAATAGGCSDKGAPMSDSPAEV